MKEIEFQCKRDNLTVYGLQILPEDYENKKLPAIIASHGFTDNLYGMKGFCDELVKEGYACFGKLAVDGLGKPYNAAQAFDGNGRLWTFNDLP